MTTKYISKLSLILFIGLGLLVFSCKQNTPNVSIKSQDQEQNINAKVTFIEFGATKCVACIEMQPVVKTIEERYHDQVKVEFNDVWTDKGKDNADKYNVKLIPLQVFLDENGEEFFRHEGFFSVEEIEGILKSKGIQ